MPLNPDNTPAHNMLKRRGRFLEANSRRRCRSSLFTLVLDRDQVIRQITEIES